MKNEKDLKLIEEQFIKDLIHAASDGKIKIHEAYIEDTIIEIDIATKEGDLINRLTLPISDWSGADEIPLGQDERVTPEGFMNFVQENKDFINFPFLSDDELNRASKVLIAIGDKMSDGGWDDFVMTFNYNIE